MTTLDLLAADEIIAIRDHVTALLAVDDQIIDPDEREALLGLDQRLERAIKQRAFHESLKPAESAYTAAYRKAARREHG
jgi:hypothetical protein